MPTAVVPDWTGCGHEDAMITPSLSISIDRTSLSLGALVLYGSNGGGTLAVSRFVEPGQVARIVYAPDVPGLSGSIPLASSYQQAVLSFDAFPADAATEAIAQAAIGDLRAALAQFSYQVTTIVSGSQNVWACDTGSISLANPEGRTYADLANLNPTYAVTIPCKPMTP